MPFDVIDILLNSGLEQDAVLTTASGTRTIKVIYYNKYKASRLREMELDSVNPYLVCRTSDIEDARKGDGFEGLEDDPLYIDSIQHEGLGKTIIELKFD